MSNRQKKLRLMKKYFFILEIPYASNKDFKIADVEVSFTTDVVVNEESEILDLELVWVPSNKEQERIKIPFDMLESWSIMEGVRDNLYQMCFEKAKEDKY